LGRETERRHRLGNQEKNEVRRGGKVILGMIKVKEKNSENYRGRLGKGA
jgi:hypothetical protein